MGTTQTTFRENTVTPLLLYPASTANLCPSPACAGLTDSHFPFLAGHIGQVA